ncbi:MAG TPA: tRNA 2-thiouridine(34) synthase MnmA [bacterium]|nr:tRNA 2-thiouridine(34) synthase MnmA [bacterium]
MRKKTRIRVVVGMSGGVDSTAAAALLQKKGYEVIGMTMALSTPASRCCSEQDVHDARRMAHKLGILHYVIPMHGPFQERVIAYFASEYAAGRTPNPCAVCNPAIKFGELLRKAREAGGELLATGHYARITRDPGNGRFLLRRGRERGKDQSYFLARLSQEALGWTLFPVGGFPKAKIRGLAESLGLDVSRKRDSQDVCFVPDSGVLSYLESLRGSPFPPGPIRDRPGRLLGEHRGIAGYTIGQRRGLGIAAKNPLYVTGIDAESNTVFVGEEKELYGDACLASDPNWIAEGDIPETLRAHVRIRYKHRAAKALIEKRDGGTIRIRFDRPQRAVTPGQLAVFYRGDVVLGSAWIDSVLNLS